MTGKTGWGITSALLISSQKPNIKKAKERSTKTTLDPESISKSAWFSPQQKGTTSEQDFSLFSAGPEGKDLKDDIDLREYIEQRPELDIPAIKIDPQIHLTNAHEILPGEGRYWNKDDVASDFSLFVQDVSSGFFIKVASTNGEEFFCCHYNSSFSICWRDIFNCFKSRDLDVTFIGGLPLSKLDQWPNVDVFESLFQELDSDDVKLEEVFFSSQCMRDSFAKKVETDLKFKFYDSDTKKYDEHSLKYLPSVALYVNAEGQVYQVQNEEILRLDYTESVSCQIVDLYETATVYDECFENLILRAVRPMMMELGIFRRKLIKEDGYWKKHLPPISIAKNQDISRIPLDDVLDFVDFAKRYDSFSGNKDYQNMLLKPYLSAVQEKIFPKAVLDVLWNDFDDFSEQREHVAKQFLYCVKFVGEYFSEEAQ